MECLEKEQGFEQIFTVWKKYDQTGVQCKSKTRRGCNTVTSVCKPMCRHLSYSSGWKVKQKYEQKTSKSV